ncbi:MAG: WG repeat-containing protein [Candidatus Cryptobacteroides sp.]
MKPNLKSILNASWKVGLGLIGAGVAVFTILLSIAFCESHYGRYEWRDRTLSKDVVVRAYKNNTVRIWNKASKEYTTKKIRWVSGEPCKGDSLTVFCDKEGKRGYVNVKTGEIVIPAQYSKAWNFSEGVAGVLGADNRIGFIDKDNRLVIDYIIPFEKTTDYVFKDGYCIAESYEDDGRHYAMYRKDGSIALDWSHRRIEGPENGYRIVANDDGCWLLDGELDRVFPDAYDDISFAESNDGVYVEKDHVKRLISYDGTVLEPFVIDNTYRLEYEVMNEDGDAYSRVMVDDVLVYMVDGWEGLMDARTGKIITPAIYWNFEMVSKDLLRAKLGYGDESVILDKTGKVIKL